jgi:uncharacterized protein YjbI with pentapeptide repeats
MVEETKGIFISYRRGDAAYAGWLAERLSGHFGEDMVFRDIDSVALGEDFVEAIESALEASVVMIVVVGRNWATELKEREQRGQEDYTRLEIATALDRNNVQVIPVLVQGAAMPRADELPSDLAALARRNAIELHDTNWQSDIQRLITSLEKVTRRRQPTAPPIDPETALQAYLEQLRQEVREGLRDEDPLSPIRMLTRGRTLRLFWQLDPQRKRDLLQTLHEAGLIRKGTPVIGLSGADLRNANLRYLTLENGALDGAILEKADLRDAKLSNIDLGGAYLSGADLRDADLRGALLVNADLQRKDELNLSSADLKGANLQRAILYSTNLYGANLLGANLQQANLQQANLQEANLRRADLLGAKLQGANLQGAHLQGAELQEANLRGAIVTDEQLATCKRLVDATMPNGQKYEDWIQDKEGSGKGVENE